MMASKEGNMEDLANEILQEKGYYFKIKEKQFEIIKSIIGGIDTFAVLPTGYGKSVCSTLPPLMLDNMHCPKLHTSVVISPLKSLILDQVKTLKDHNIKAYGIHEGIEKADVDAIKSGCATVLIASPEAIITKQWKSVLDNAYREKLCMVAYDEAHSISECCGRKLDAVDEMADFVFHYVMHFPEVLPYLVVTAGNRPKEHALVQAVPT